MSLLRRARDWLAGLLKWDCARCGAPTERAPYVDREECPDLVPEAHPGKVSLCPPCHDAVLRERAAAHPDRFRYACGYCGAPTTMEPYSGERGDWPACCSRFGCLEQWSPRRAP